MGFSRYAHSPSRRSRAAIAFAAIVSATILFSTAQAQSLSDLSSSASEATPWAADDLVDPSAVDAAGDYVSDPGFHGGEYIEDAFGANQNSPTNYFLGRKVAKLPDGDIVAAALVKNPNGNQTNGFWNVGLVRYSPDGSMRRTWANPGNFGSSNNQYVVYPKTDTASFSWIQDIKVVDHFILVSTNLNFNGTADVDTYLLVFDLDGHFYRAQSVFGTGAGEFIGGMEPYTTFGTIDVVVAATRVPAAGGTARPIFTRLSLNDDGTLTDQTDTVDLTASACVDTRDGCEVKALALAYPATLGTAPNVFIAAAFSFRGTSADKNIAVMYVDSNGNAISSWNPNIIQYNTATGGNLADLPFGIAVKSTGLGIPASPRVHTVYVASYIDRVCKSGISVLRQSTADNGASATATTYGGSDDASNNCFFFANQDIGNGVAIQDGKLAIAGYTVRNNVLGEDSVDAELAIFDDLNLISLDTYPYPINGPRDRHTGFYGVVGTGDGKFVATGDNRFRNDDDVPESLRGKQSVAVLGLAPDDGIFTNGFENP